MPKTQHFTKGVAINYKGQPWLIIDNQFVNPGKGAAFTKAKMRNLKTGQVMEVTFKSGESEELADVARKKCQFLYEANGTYSFMDNETYEQFELDKEVIGDNKYYLLDGAECYALHIDGTPVSIQAPPKIELRVSRTTPGVKGDTATGGNKECTMETGLVVKTPLFIEEGEKLIINTESGEYVSRA